MENSNKRREESFVVTEDRTAQAMESGEVMALATPQLVAMMERACWKLAAGELAEGETTVGTYIATTHERASAVGNTVTVEAEMTERNGREMKFRVTATDGGSVIARAEHTRFVVDKARFESKLKK